MVTTIAAASAAALGAAVAMLVAFALRARSERRFDAVLRRVDDHMGAISASLGRAIDDALELRQERRRALPPTLRLDELLEALAAEAAAKSGAQSVTARIDGPEGRPVVASFGPDAVGQLLDATLGPPDARPFRAARIDWTYGPAQEAGADLYRSALVVPIVEDGETTGAVAAFAVAAGAFRHDHVRAVQELIEDAAPGITAARRFAELEARSLLDPATGARSRRGYELELEREIARARRSGRPLSLVVLELESESQVDDLARVVTRTARATDVVCRKRQRELAVVLPDTTGIGADLFTARLRAETASALGREGPPTVTVGLVEWQPDETVEALDSRASAALGRTAAVRPAPRADETAAGSPAERASGAAASSTERHTLQRLAHELEQARLHEGPLALLAVDVHGVEAVAERSGASAADALMTALVERFDALVGGTSLRTAPSELAVVLRRTTGRDAEHALATIQSSLREDPLRGDVRLTLTAGITELTADGDAHGAIRRAELALWQARQAGTGTVVIATPGPDASG